jgi:hypothetical protein
MPSALAVITVIAASIFAILFIATAVLLILKMIGSMG